MKASTVTLVLCDHSKLEMSVLEAIRYCGDPVLSGYVIDALTPDEDLQNSLRRLMDRANKPERDRTKSP